MNVLKTLTVIGVVIGGLVLWDAFNARKAGLSPPYDCLECVGRVLVLRS